MPVSDTRPKHGGTHRCRNLAEDKSMRSQVQKLLEYKGTAEGSLKEIKGLRQKMRCVILN